MLNYLSNMPMKTTHTRKRYHSLEAIKREFFPRSMVEGERQIRVISNRPTMPSLIESVLKEYEKSKAKASA